MTEVTCDICRRPFGLESFGHSDEVEISLTTLGIYLRGKLLISRDGKSANADICESCLRAKLLASPEIKFESKNRDRPETH